MEHPSEADCKLKERAVLFSFPESHRHWIGGKRKWRNRKINVMEQLCTVTDNKNGPRTSWRAFWGLSYPLGLPDTGQQVWDNEADERAGERTITCLEIPALKNRRLLALPTSGHPHRLSLCSQCFLGTQFPEMVSFHPTAISKDQPQRKDLIFPIGNNHPTTLKC